MPHIDQGVWPFHSSSKQLDTCCSASSRFIDPILQTKIVVVRQSVIALVPKIAMSD